MKPYIAYYRVSTSKQGADGNGIEAQKLAVARYLSTLHAELIASFIEVDSGRNNQRIELTKALALAKQKNATLVIAKLDRLSRNAAFLLALQDSGVQFVCCDVPQACPLTIGVLALLAQREAILLATRTREGMAALKLKNPSVKFGNPRYDEAVKRGRAAIQRRKEEFHGYIIPIINEIRQTGIESYKRLSDCLNKRGEKTRGGSPFTPTAVRRLLINKR